MSAKKILPIIVVGFMLFGCEKKTDTYTTLHVGEPLRVVCELSDSTFMQQVKSLLVYKNNIYFCDSRTNRIIRLDSVFNVDLSFGQSGRGPGEFTYLGSIDMYNGNIYAWDAPQKIIQFDLNGNYIKTLQMPTREIMSKNFMINHDGNLLYSVVDTLPIYISNSNNNNIPLVKFGTITPKCKGVTPNFERYRFVKKNDNSFFAVCAFRPLVLEYDYSGNLLSKIDFSDSKYFKKLLKKAKESIKKNDGYYVFFSDACMNNDTLYLLATIHDEYDEPEVQNILFVVDTAESRPKMMNYIVLENNKEPWYDCFCIKDNELIAFDAISKCMCIYDMNQLTETGNQNETQK